MARRALSAGRAYLGLLFLLVLAPAIGVCPAGEHLLADNTRCAPCPAGYFSEDGAACQPCPRGRFSGEGAARCSQCPEGSISIHQASQRCYCNLGYYEASNASDDLLCRSCPPGRSTPELNSIGVEACKCMDGYFYVRELDECRPCSEGMQCSGLSEEPRDTLPGYVAHESAAHDAGRRVVYYRCTSARACPGGGVGACSSGGRGIACADCKQGFRWDGLDCVKPLADTAMGLKLFALFVILTVAVLLCYWAVNSYALEDLSVGVTLSAALGMLISALQIMCVYSHAQVRWGPSLNHWFLVLRYNHLPVRIVSWLLDVTSETDVVAINVFVATLPLAVVALHAAIWVTKRCLGAFACASEPLASLKGRWHATGHDVCDKCVNSVGATVYAALTLIMLQVFNPFMTYEHPGAAGRSVKASPHVLEGSEAHTQLVVIAVCELMLYCVTYLSVCIWAAWRMASLRASRSVSRKPGFTRVFLRFRFLIYRFKPQYHFWGLVLSTRAVVMSLTAVIGHNCHVQIISMLLVMMGFLLAHCFAWPYKLQVINVADAILQVLLISIIACGAFVVDEQHGKGDYRGFVSQMVFAFLLFIAALFAYLLAHPLLAKLYAGCAHLAAPSKLELRDRTTGEIEGLFLADLLRQSCVPQLEFTFPAGFLAGSANVKEKELLVTVKNSHVHQQEVVYANLKLSRSDSDSQHSLRMQFNSEMLAWRNALEEQLKREQQLFVCMRALLRSQIDGCIIIIRVVESGHVRYKIKEDDDSARQVLVDQSRTNADLTVSLKGKFFDDFIQDRSRYEVFMKMLQDASFAQQISLPLRRNMPPFSADFLMSPMDKQGQEIFVGVRGTPLDGDEEMDAARRLLSDGSDVGKWQSDADLPTLEMGNEPTRFVPPEGDPPLWAVLESQWPFVFTECSARFNVFFQQKMEGLALLDCIDSTEEQELTGKAIARAMQRTDSQNVNVRLCKLSRRRRGRRRRRTLSLQPEVLLKFSCFPASITAREQTRNTLIVEVCQIDIPAAAGEAHSPRKRPESGPVSRQLVDAVAAQRSNSSVDSSLSDEAMAVNGQASQLPNNIVIFDVLSERFTVLEYTDEFGSMVGPDQEGKSLLDWVVERDSFFRWVQDYVNAHMNDDPELTPSPFQVVFRPSLAVSQGVEFVTQCMLFVADRATVAGHKSTARSGMSEISECEQLVGNLVISSARQRPLSPKDLDEMADCWPVTKL